MSTILDALKRLEREDREARAPQVPRSMAEGQKPPHRFRLRGPGWLLVALVALASGAALVWLNGGLSGSVFSRKAPRPEPPVAAAAPDAFAGKAANVEAAVKPASTETVGIAQPDPSRRSPGHEEGADRLAQTSRHTVLPAYSKQFRAKSRAASPSPEAPSAGVSRLSPVDPADLTGTPQTVRTDPESSAATPQQPSKPEPFANAQPLSRGILQLQAISWSDIPSARITVIDGRILREGHSVAGYTVVRIQPEDIILDKDGRHWKLAYGRP